MPRRLPILTHPNPILRKKTEDVPLEKIRERDFQHFLDDMGKTMLEADGIGLAAIQVGAPVNVAVINFTDGPIPLVNPHIVQYGKKKDVAIEACLSVPGLAGNVRRSIEITVEALDRNGEPIAFEAKDLLARVVQHEVDHLNGILFIDRAEKIWKDEEPPKAANS